MRNHHPAKAGGGPRGGKDRQAGRAQRHGRHAGPDRPHADHAAILVAAADAKRRAGGKARPLRNGNADRSHLSARSSRPAEQRRG